MHFVLIVAVLLATMLAEKAPAEAVDHTAARTLLALVAMLLAPALAATMSAVVIRGLRHDGHTWAAWVARFSAGQQIHAGLLVLIVGLISYGLAWPQVVRVNMGLGNWILVDDLLILAPVYVPLLLSWAAFYDVDRAVHELMAEDEPSDSPGRWQYVLLHARHYLGLVMIPLLLVLGVYDTARWLAPEFIAGPHAWLLVMPLLVVLIACMPQVIATLWKTVPLPAGELRTYLRTVLDDCRLRVRDVLVWQTDGRVTNAAVSGFLPQLRYVFLTDRLIEVLDDDEIAAVLRHEAGHVVRHHLLLRMLCLGLPVAVWASVGQVAPQAIEALTGALESAGLSLYLQECMLLPGAVALYALVVLGGYCKRLEFQADLYASGLLTQSAETIAARTLAFMRALTKITLSSGGSRTREGWLHPSIARRVSFLRAAQSDPLLACAFERRTTWIALGMVLTYVMAIALLLPRWS
jgi:STE24 endopeptidase